MKHVRVGVVGAGFLAQTRARCWKAATGAHLAGVTAKRAERASAFAQQHGVAQIFESFEQLIASDAVDLIDLCIPNQLHRPMAVAAAEAGKHVLCTKPLTAYVGQDLGEQASDEEIAGRDRVTMARVARADAEAMVDAAERAGVRLFYGENWVYAPAIVKARALLERAGAALLELRGWEAHSGSHSEYARSWRHTGGGALLRLGAHPIGAMLHLKRAEGLRNDGEPIRPLAVTGEVADLTRVAGVNPANLRLATGWRGVENWGCAIIQFSDGARGVAYGSDNLLGGMESRLEIQGSNAAIRCNLSPHDLVRAYAPDAEVFGDAYIQEKLDSGAGWTTPLPDEDWSSGQLAMCQAFADALHRDVPAEADGQLGLDVTRVVYAAYVSAAEGRRVPLD
ncbi:MAG: Gfo/Idh/MocA family oxidoreductase [Myxococcota bacterium]|nr:Gfo/Idh/MocA family oxidoreductase [Myxococcota bacterium]